MSVESQFEVNQLVWAKVDGYPWWPGFIKSIGVKGKIEVMFFDDFTRAFIKDDKIMDFEADQLTYLKNKAQYKKAMDQISRI